MLEREQPSAVSVSPTATVDEVLIELVQRARNAEGDERTQLCDRVNDTLASLRSAPDPATAARRVLTLLDDEALHGLVDSSGAECRRRALEAVMALGFPWALHIEPEDLDYLRARSAPARKYAWGWWVALVVLGLSAGAFLKFWVSAPIEDRGAPAGVRRSPRLEERPSQPRSMPGAPRPE